MYGILTAVQISKGQFNSYDITSMSSLLNYMLLELSNSILSTSWLSD